MIAILKETGIAASSNLRVSGCLLRWLRSHPDEVNPDICFRGGHGFRTTIAQEAFEAPNQLFPDNILFLVHTHAGHKGLNLLSMEIMFTTILHSVLSQWGKLFSPGLWSQGCRMKRHMPPSCRCSDRGGILVRARRASQDQEWLVGNLRRTLMQLSSVAIVGNLGTYTPHSPQSPQPMPPATS